VDLFIQNLVKPQGALSTGDSITATTQDLLLLLIPYLPAVDAIALFQKCLSTEILGSKDNGVQKRGYKILAKLTENGKVVIDTETVLRRLDELSDGLSPAAKKVSSTPCHHLALISAQDRFMLLILLIPSIPASAMHIIPSLIPEAVLGTKEPSEKARSAAFDLVLAMGRKMGDGGIVHRRMVDGMDEDSAEGHISLHCAIFLFC
jgi:ribosomal RNA-processing protein 12